MPNSEEQYGQPLHCDPASRLTHRTIVITEHYAADNDGATAEELTSAVEQIKILRTLIRRTTNRG